MFITSLLQGSLAIDVDIKDYDSTSKDDDIDHLFYTFKSIASTEKVSVVLNGTRVRYDRFHRTLQYILFPRMYIV